MAATINEASPSTWNDFHDLNQQQKVERLKNYLVIQIIPFHRICDQIHHWPDYFLNLLYAYIRKNFIGSLNKREQNDLILELIGLNNAYKSTLKRTELEERAYERDIQLFEQKEKKEKKQEFEKLQRRLKELKRAEEEQEYEELERRLAELKRAEEEQGMQDLLARFAKLNSPGGGTKRKRASKRSRVPKRRNKKTKGRFGFGRTAKK